MRNNNINGFRLLQELQVEILVLINKDLNLRDVPKEREAMAWWIVSWELEKQAIVPFSTSLGFYSNLADQRCATVHQVSAFRHEFFAEIDYNIQLPWWPPKQLSQSKYKKHKTWYDWSCVTYISLFSYKNSGYQKRTWDEDSQRETMHTCYPEILVWFGSKLTYNNITVNK